MSALPPDETPWDLLAKQLAGAATAAERAQLRAWAAGQPAREQLLASAAHAWQRAGAEAPTPASTFTAADENAAWQRFQANLNAPAAAPVMTAASTPAPAAGTAAPTGREGRAGLRHPGYRPPWLRAAAAVLLVLGALFLLRSSWRPRAASRETVAATGAQKQRLTLPDGSQVWLNRHSTLRYAAGFDAEHRVVQLAGEAFFAVQKAQGRPFTVLSATARTRVLGTSFNVRAYGAEDSVEVAVATGRVSLAPRRAAAGADSVLLRPGERGVLRHPETAPRRTAAADANFRGWQRDELSFDQAPVGHVLRTLRTTFGAEVAVADSALLRYRFTGTFARPTAEQVLRVLSRATNSTYTRRADGRYELAPEAGSSAPVQQPE